MSFDFRVYIEAYCNRIAEETSDIKNPHDSNLPRLLHIIISLKRADAQIQTPAHVVLMMTAISRDITAQFYANWLNELIILFDDQTDTQTDR